MKKILGIIIIIGAIGAFASFQFYFVRTDVAAPSDKTNSEASPKDEFRYQGEEGKTALEILQEVAQVHMTGTGENAFVTTINGREVDLPKREYWGFFVNGEMAQVGAGSYMTKEGDLIVWKIAAY